jgi:hypothetical protein
MGAPPTAHEASLLMGATMAASMIGIFLGIFFLFMSIDTAVRLAAATLVGIVGILSFIRHSVYFASDQVRMGWRQDRPEFQIEVGYVNLAIGIWALVAAALSWGLVCGVMLATYATYLFCALLLHSHRPGSGRTCTTRRSVSVRSKASSRPGFSFWHSSDFPW